MSISALSQYFGVDWRTVKDIEKRTLLKKYARIDLSEVRIMGVDEIYVGKKKYKTVVRPWKADVCYTLETATRKAPLRFPHR